MIYVVQNEDVYDVRFPYDLELIAAVKNVPGRVWSPESKCWKIPLARLGFLIQQLTGTPYEQQLIIKSAEQLDVNASLDATTHVPDVDISDVDWYINKNYKVFAHQKDALKYDKWRNDNGLKSGFILADEPGLAKTATVLNIAMYHRKRYGSKHCLIIACVNSAKYNWREDIIKNSNGQLVPYILGSRLKRNGDVRSDTGGKEKMEDLMSMTMYGKQDQPLPYFIIVNIEAIGRTKMGKSYILANRLIELVNSGEIGVIALDEIHKNTSPTSIQGKQLLRMKKQITKSVEWIPMTGTPIQSKPTDIFLPLLLVDGHKNTSFYTWCQTYCVYGGFGGKEIIGYRNIPELKSRLQPNMLRRRKDDVLDLPPKIRHTEYVENTDYQARLYAKTAGILRENRGEIQHSMNPLAQFLRLRQVNGSPELVDETVSPDDSNYLSKNAKLSRLLDLVEEITSNGEKIVIFSNWVEPLRTLYKFISKRYKTCCYTGTMSQEDREKHKRVFINNPNYMIMLGTVGALGTSHTLTVARNIIFYDEPWNPSDIEQCEDRCHRAGTTQSVNIYSLITKDTVDETVHDILSRKEGTANYIVDDELDLKAHPELIDLLLR